MTGVLEVVAEPHRRRILDLLLEGEKSAGEIVAALPLSQPGVSKHLKVLKDAGLVTVRQQARLRLYRLRPGPLREIDVWLAPFRDAWNERLDALESHLDTMEET
ncbi:ArsR/SmtB family transcription factor [Nocardiopsis flavescens]|uniref:DNA-binding transcriptional regulator, ArsR family n=1 Tax=Nocardiopsis flavescens TaxID=758803 RepID=A0A1M6PX33_9ACTN|nr:metalloregulator ArsR/SmtB family transcription factor [Nocardiopsis flavescens]SHK12490.1 DNA-binding transcriptional regulator, ArsR family [Nocardiopsis flavescens]